MRDEFPTSESNEALESADPFIVAMREAGLLDRASLDRLLRAKAASRDSTVLLAQRLGLIGEQELLSCLARITGLPTLREAGIALDAGADLSGFNRNFLKSAHAFPFVLPDGSIALAISDPFNRTAIDAVAYKLGRPIACFIASVSEIDAALARLSGEPAAERVEARASAADLETLQDLASGAPVIKAVAAVIEKASIIGASDIHFEPTETDLRVRMRINGALQDMNPIPYAQKLAAISRLKILAQMDIAETRLPQDGRAKSTVRGRDVDLRVSTAPTLHGECVAVRILDRTAVSLDLEALGFSADNRRAFQSALAAPNGLVFVSGPTGSGKTTTLYAALTSINDPSRKIFTVEDPIEYRLRGVSQVQVNPKIGLTFANALRSLLRQDPDIMMVGEVRDAETAEISVQAALTGHLVLATIHTNSAAATVTRLLDMGIEDYLIASCAGAFIAQRLVGTLCPSCAKPAPARRAVFERFGLAVGEEQTIRQATGCPACRHTGFAGRTTISEVIHVTEEISEAIARRAPASEIEKIAEAQGRRTMVQDGLLKAMEGVTSVDEVLRAVRT